MLDGPVTMDGCELPCGSLEPNPNPLVFNHSKIKGTNTPAKGGQANLYICPKDGSVAAVSRYHQDSFVKLAPHTVRRKLQRGFLYCRLFT